MNYLFHSLISRHHKALVILEPPPISPSPSLARLDDSPCGYSRGLDIYDGRFLLDMS